MPVFSKASESNLSTCHPDLQKIARKAIKIFDFRIIEGHRGKKKQNGYFASGLSKVKWPDGKHNKWPAEAIDVEPYPKFLPDVQDNRINVYSKKGEVRFYLLVGIIMGIAQATGVNIRWGGDWNRDFNPHNEKWDDFPHVELVNARSLTDEEKASFSKIIKA